MTELLYLKDCYLKEFDAIVTSVKDEKYVVLDKTAFYPVGGGEPHDTGKIICDNIEYDVIFVGKFDGKISHEVNKEGLKEGDKVHGIINLDRRYKLMRMHTAAHIIDSVIHKESGALFTGNQLGEDKSRLDFNLEKFDKERMKGYIDMANQEIKKGKNVTITFMPKEEAEKLSMLFEWDYGNMKEMRVIDIEGIDKQPCGGCHIKNTSEIKGVEFVSVDNKGAGRKRLYFKLVD